MGSLPSLKAIALCAVLAVGVLGCQAKKDKASKASKAETAVDSIGKDAAPAPPLAIKPVPLPGDMVPAPWLLGATRVVAFTAESGPIIVAGGTGWLRWFDKDGTLLGERKTAGATQSLETFDIDGDGKDEVVVGRGMARDAIDAPISLEVVYLQESLDAKRKTPRTESIELPKTSRAQVVAIAAVPGGKDELWAASFVNKYEVEVAHYQRDAAGAWTQAESRGRHRVVGDLSVMPDGTPVIARFYGDTADEDGGVYALPSEGEPIALPSTRGARAVLALPGPAFHLAMADGWHKNYGKKAQGLVTVIAKAEQGYKQVSSVQVEGNFGYTQLRLSFVHRDPGPELLASGNGNAVVVLPRRPDLLFELAGAEAVDAFPIQLSGDPRMEVVIAGPQPAIWTPR